MVIKKLLVVKKYIDEYKYIVNCDWGTSKLRMYLTKITDRSVLAFIQTPEGIEPVFNQWIEGDNTNQPLERKKHYLRYLYRGLNRLQREVDFTFDEIVIVASGMVSSSIGLLELHYANLPFPLNGANSVLQRIEPTSEFPVETWIVSGVAGSNEVMRGEETQMIGLADNIPWNDLSPEIICIFPGTHSKHLFINKKKIVNFTTFITGEMFHLVKEYSILKGSLVIESDNIIEISDQPAFTEGVRRATASDLLETLFSVRTKKLLQNYSQLACFAYLNGILIGSELKSLIKYGKHSLVLCCENPLSKLYRLAMTELDFSSHMLVLQPEIVSRSAVEGQIAIMLYQNFLK